MAYIIKIGNDTFNAKAFSISYVSHGQETNTITFHLSSMEELNTIRTYSSNWMLNEINGIEIYNSDNELIKNLNYKFNLFDLNAHSAISPIADDQVDTIFYTVVFKTEWISASS